MKAKWKAAQKWERDWWGNCANTYNEETKQYRYAEKMGLLQFATNYYGIHGWDFGNRSILDVGGGPCSILLKSVAKQKVVVDPCRYPDWVGSRYDTCEVEYLRLRAEDMQFDKVFDITLCYNVLQHVEDPEKIVRKMLLCSKEVRLFEWIETGVGPGHPNDLHRNDLDRWLGGHGKVEPAVRGGSYAGIFLGAHFEVSV